MSVWIMPGWDEYIAGGIMPVEVEEVGFGLLLRELRRPFGVELLMRVEARSEALRGVSSSSSAVDAARVDDPAELEEKYEVVYGFEEGASAVMTSRSVKRLLLSYEIVVLTPWKSSMANVLA